MKQSEFTYSPENIVWILPYLYSIREGLSPFESEFKVRHEQANTQATFVKWCELAALINNRIDKCGNDGLLVRWFYCESHPIKQVAKAQSLPVAIALKKIDWVILYISGRKEREISYSYWADLRRRHFKIT